MYDLHERADNNIKKKRTPLTKILDPPLPSIATVHRPAFHLTAFETGEY